MAKPGYHEPIKSIVGQTDFHKCRSCNRKLGHAQFAPLYSASTYESRGFRKKQLLHPYCHKCRGLVAGKWREHPSYSVSADLFISSLVSAAKNSALRRGIPFLLQKDDVLGLLLQQNGKCAMSGIEMMLEQSNGTRNDVRASIDRINSSEGYVQGNVHLVCAIVNIMKNDLSHQRFISLCEKIVKHQADKEDDLIEALS